MIVFYKGRTFLSIVKIVSKKVIEDPQSLYDYSENKKAHTGVRAVRVVY